jgi:hypothetical protein
MDGKLFIYSGMPEEDDDHIHGVGILLNRQMKGSLIGCSAVLECLITVSIQDVSKPPGGALFWRNVLVSLETQD